jgi:hypothetical protein
MALVVLAFCAVPAFAQTLPWYVYQDDASDSVCDAVNAANAELVVLSATAQLVLVTGQDLILEDTFVDVDNFVYFEGSPAGVIDFALDGDGLRSLWWLSLTGHVVQVDGFTGEPTITAYLPSDYINAACDACDYWDDPFVCPGNDVDWPITFNFCGAGAQASLALTLMSLSLMGLTRRRWG